MHTANSEAGADPSIQSGINAASNKPPVDPNQAHGKQQVEVFYTADKKRFELDAGTYTIEQLKVIFEVESGYLLELFEQGHFIEVTGPIELKNGMHFNSFAPVGTSS